MSQLIIINAHPDMVDIEESLRDLSATVENNISSVVALFCDYCFRLLLERMGITNAGAKPISQTLHHNSALGILNSSNNSISDDGVVALAQVLHHDSTMRYLAMMALVKKVLVNYCI